ncbi:beta-lactamase/transpeptidase-like protein [Ceraceosorus guamensis]|uniref:Beta-lactamase/transpeptidase-like protein n=1 Tax=Ceraceosorus guamensis TaxID=1522189 RepID=A0A316W5Q6_9BASI|nr:beta-lactamase/transpeptidase-like protein [Ceraceosorus guamensis]PWN42985.1 beta-lactamase/transpeptidase-like protein [Ceraceosorus guamensis]
MRGILISIIAFTAAAFAAPLNEGVSRQRVLDSDTRAFVQSVLDHFNVPGAAMAIVTPAGSGIEYFGVKDLEGNPITESTYYAIASNSKWVTALAIATFESWKNVTVPSTGQLFSFETRLKDIFLDDWNMQDAAATEQATVADLLTMRTGVPKHDFYIRKDQSSLDAIRALGQLKPSHPFRERYQYATSHYGAAAALFPTLLNQTLDDFLEQHFWTPLGIQAYTNATQLRADDVDIGAGFNTVASNGTQCALDLSANKSYASSSACLGRTEVFDFWTETSAIEQDGGGSVIFTPKDMLKWAHESIDPKVIPEEALDQAIHHESQPVSGPITYGFGVSKAETPDGELLFHGGALPGHNSNFLRNIGKGIAIFTMTNADPIGFTLADLLNAEIYTRLIGKPPKDLIKTFETSLAVVIPPGQLPPPNPVPPTPDQGDNLVGAVLRHPAYPEIRLQPLNLTGCNGLESAGIPADFIQIDVTTVSPINVSSSNKAFYAQWKGSFTSHIVFTHFGGPHYNYTMLLTFDKQGEQDEDALNTRERRDPDAFLIQARQSAAKGDKPAPVKSTCPSKYTAKFFGQGPAVFTADGIGFFGAFWAGDDPSIAVAPVTENVRQEAIAFFGR